jgi:hypothetical protein
LKKQEFQAEQHLRVTKTPRTTFAWPVLHNFTPAVESLSPEMYFLFTPAWFVPLWRRQNSMPLIIPSDNPTADGKASAKALRTDTKPADVREEYS